MRNLEINIHNRSVIKDGKSIDAKEVLLSGGTVRTVIVLTGRNQIDVVLVPQNLDEETWKNHAEIAREVVKDFEGSVLLTVGYESLNERLAHYASGTPSFDEHGGVETFGHGGPFYDGFSPDLKNFMLNADFIRTVDEAHKVDSRLLISSDSIFEENNCMWALWITVRRAICEALNIQMPLKGEY